MASVRMLFTSSPGVGHLLPILPVARAAARRGHEVVVGTGASLEDLVTRSGLRHSPMGARSLDDIRAKIPAIATAAGRERASLMYRRGFAEVAASAMVDAVLEVATRWRPDV